MIASSLFSKRGKMSPSLMRSLMVRGSGIQVDDCLRRFGWDGAEGVIATVCNINSDTGTVTGVRFESRGKGPEVTFRAKDLWKGADDDISVKLSFSDLSQVKWKAQGSSRNQSSWMDSTELVVSYFRGEEVLDTRADLDAVSVGGFTVRPTVTPLKVDKIVLYGGILPLSKEDLEAKVAEAGLCQHTHSCSKALAGQG